MVLCNTYSMYQATILASAPCGDMAIKFCFLTCIETFKWSVALQAKGITIRKNDTRRMEEEAIPLALCSSWGTTYLMAVGVAMEGCVILCEMSIPCSLCSQFFLNGVQTLHSWRASFVWIRSKRRNKWKQSWNSCGEPWMWMPESSILPFVLEMFVCW